MIARGMRAADRREIELTTGADPEAVCLSGVQDGARAFVAVGDGVPVALFGAREAGEGIANAWMFATDAVPWERDRYHHTARLGIGLLMEHWPYLACTVPAESGVRRRWLASLGFEEVYTKEAVRGHRGDLLIIACYGRKPDV